MDYSKGSVVEVVVGGTTYIGKFEEATDKVLVLKDAMKCALAPHPAPEGQGIIMVPKLDLINFYSNGDVMKFKLDDIMYDAEITGKNFITNYTQQYDMYAKMKIEQGSDIQVVPAGSVDGIQSN